MKSTKWKNEAFDFPSDIPTMISPEEKQYLHWLGSSAWQGKGLVVEIGPWLGGSTWCLAAGMQSSRNRTSKRLVVYDNFIWREFMSERAMLNLGPGDCFQTEFLKNVSKFDSVVDSYKRTLPDEVIASDLDAQSKRYVADEDVELFQGVAGSESVEILFVDGAKSWLGLKHLLQHVYDRMIPDCSMIVCQDFKYWGNYWVPMMTSLLRDYMQPVHNVVSSTTVTFRLVEPIPQNILEALPNHIADVPTNDALAAIDSACDMLRDHGDVPGSANVELGKVMLLTHQGRLDSAVTIFREVQLSWPHVAGTAQLERARKHLAESHAVKIPPTLAIRALGQASRAVQTAKRIAGRIQKLRGRG